MFPIPLTDTPASAPADRGPGRARLRGGVEIASPPPGGGAHHAAPKSASKASSFATLIDAGLVKATLIAAAAGTDAGTASVDVADNVAANGEGTAAGAAPVGLPGKAVDARRRAHAGRHKGSIRVDAATVLPAWMQSTKVTLTRRSDVPAPTASNDGDTADDGALDALAAVPTPVPVNPQPAVPLAIDLQMLATQIPVPGDENATADSTSEQPGDGASSVTSGNWGLANGRVTLGARFGHAQPAPADNAGNSRGAQTALAHASAQAVAHASTNAVLNQTAADASLADPSNAEPQIIDLQSADDSLLERLTSAATVDTTGKTADASKRAHSSVREIAQSGSAATHSTQPVPAPPAAAQNGLAPSSSRSTAADGGAAQTDAARKLSPSVEPARRSDAASIPSIRFGETANADTDTAGNSEDSPRDSHQPPSASAATRLMAGVVSVAGDAQASTQAHAVAPVFTVPTAAPVTATPTVASTEAPAPANAPTIDAQNIDRLVQSMHVNAKSGVMEATVRLRPDYLGDVTIELRVDGTGVSAVVRAESAGVRQWLESHEETIRNGLAEHGLELTRFVVDPDGQQQAQQEAPRDPDEQRRAAFRRRQQAASPQRFEITV